MQKNALKYLCCPLYYGELKVDIETANNWNIISGIIKCDECGKEYKIKNEIPDFRIKECYRGVNRIQRTFYNLYAPIYDFIESKLAKFSGFKEKTLRNEIISTIDINEGDCVLEVCVGTGGNIPYYRRYTSNLIVGIDISEKMIETCKKKVKSEKYRRVDLVFRLCRVSAI